MTSVVARFSHGIKFIEIHVYVDSVIEKCVSINPRGSHLMLQTNLDELILAETESGLQVIAKFAFEGFVFVVLRTFPVISILDFQIYCKWINMH